MEASCSLISNYAAAAAKLLQSCPTLCNPIDGSPSGSPIPGILQARTLEWVAISFSNAWKWKVKGKSLSCVQLSATLWTAAYQAHPFMGFSRQEYWSGVPLPSPLSHYTSLWKWKFLPIIDICWINELRIFKLGRRKPRKEVQGIIWDVGKPGKCGATGKYMLLYICQNP